MAPRANWKGLAKPIVTQKTGEFEPDKFEDHYEAALAELINAKRNGKAITSKPRPKGSGTTVAVAIRQVPPRRAACSMTCRW